MEVYLNNAATTWPKPESVYSAVDNYLRHFGASQGRGTFKRSREATDIIEKCRSSLGQLLGITNTNRFVFTKNCSESLNTSIKGILRQGDHVITSSMEHNSVWRPLKTLELKGVISLTEVMCSPAGEIELNDVRSACQPNTRLFVFTNASNVTGTILPIVELAEIAHANHSLILVDAAQTAGICPIDVSKQNIDMLACSGHKGLLGPQGMGVLYISPQLKLETLMEGGTGSMSLSPYQPETLPARFETGTPNGPGIAGLGAGVDFILKTGVETIRAREHELTTMLLEGLRSIPGVIIYGTQNPDRQVSVVSFNLSDANPEEVGTVLDEVYNIMVRTGLHCAPEAHKTIGTIERGTVRVSPGYFNTDDEIHYFIDSIREIASKSTSEAKSLQVARDYTSKFVCGYKIVRSSPCFSDESKIRVIAELDRDVEELLPYLNASIRGAYLAEGGSFTFSYQQRPVILESKQVILGKTEDTDKAREILNSVIAIINRVAANRDTITPTNESRQSLSPYNLYRHLPRTNCRECGELTCMAFATGLVQERCRLDQCRPLQDAARTSEREAIEKLLEDYLGVLLPSGDEYL
jgi:cysteine desulfurase/selenocysteine lyase